MSHIGLGVNLLDVRQNISNLALSVCHPTAHCATLVSESALPNHLTVDLHG